MHFFKSLLISTIALTAATSAFAQYPYVQDAGLIIGTSATGNMASYVNPGDIAVSPSGFFLQSGSYLGNPSFVSTDGTSFVFPVSSTAAFLMAGSAFNLQYLPLVLRSTNPNIPLGYIGISSIAFESTGAFILGITLKGQTNINFTAPIFAYPPSVPPPNTYAAIAHYTSTGLMTNYNYITCNSNFNSDKVIIRDIVIDANNNRYVGGYFSGTCDFNPTNPGVNVASPSPYYYDDSFIVKYDSAGNFQGLYTFGGIGADLLNRLSINPANGDIAATGLVNRSLFTPGPITFPGINTSFPSQGGEDIFVLILDSSLNPIVANLAGGIANDNGKDIAFDSNSNVYITGNFGYTINFGSTTINSIGMTDIFVFKYGPYLTSSDWALSYGDIYDDSGEDLEFNACGELVVAGEFIGTINGIGTSLLYQNLPGIYSSDLFALKLNISNNPPTTIWSKTIGTTEYDNLTRMRRIDNGKLLLHGPIYNNGGFAFLINLIDNDPVIGCP